MCAANDGDLSLAFLASLMCSCIRVCNFIHVDVIEFGNLFNDKNFSTEFGRVERNA